MSIDLDSLSIAELEKIQQDASAMAERKREQAILDARAQIQQIAASVGMSLEELMGIGKTRKKTRTAKKPGKPVAIKYRNPKSPDETWTGRGRKPGWLQAELDKGRKLESFAL